MIDRYLETRMEDIRVPELNARILGSGLIMRVIEGAWDP